MRATVVVTTYNKTRELDLVLHGLARQSVMPAEVMVADDGSIDETAQLLNEWQARLDVPLHHVWHEDRGIRKALINNEAVRRSQGDYLIFLDGDSIPHRHWLADHLASARPGRVLCGRRVRLGPEISDRLAPEAVRTGSLEKIFGSVLKSRLRGGTRRFGLGIRFPRPVARLLHPTTRRLMGVNWSAPRKVFEEVNGYDSEYIGFAGEDADIDLRFRHGGFELYPLLNRAVVYHIYHPEKDLPEHLRQRVRECEESGRVRCDVGLQQ